jgi:DNA-binding XRE family transcriptional regulator
MESGDKAMEFEDARKLFCENVKRLREENGLSKKELSKIMGIGVGSLTKIESGCIPKRLSWTSAVRLAHFFEIMVQDLFI